MNTDRKEHLSPYIFVIYNAIWIQTERNISPHIYSCVIYNAVWIQAGRNISPYIYSSFIMLYEYKQEGTSLPIYIHVSFIMLYEYKQEGTFLSMYIHVIMLYEDKQKGTSLPSISLTFCKYINWLSSPPFNSLIDWLTNCYQWLKQLRQKASLQYHIVDMMHEHWYMYGESASCAIFYPWLYPNLHSPHLS